VGRGNSFKTAVLPQELTGAEEGSKLGKGAGVALWPGAGGTTCGAEAVAKGVGVAVAATIGLATGCAEGTGPEELLGLGAMGAGPQAVKLKANRADTRN